MNPNQTFEETKPTAKSKKMSNYGKKPNIRAKETITIPSDDEQVNFDTYMEHELMNCIETKAYFI